LLDKESGLGSKAEAVVSGSDLETAKELRRRLVTEGVSPASALVHEPLIEAEAIANLESFGWPVGGR
jgi:hypothetical protein